MFPRTIISLSFLLLATLARADVLLSNYPGTGTYISGSNLGFGADNNHREKAAGLTMGPQSLSFTSLIGVFSVDDGGTANVSGGIYSSVGGNPGSLLAAFNPVAVVGAIAQTVTLTTMLPFTLLSGTLYWFVLDGPTTTNLLDWNRDSANTAPTAGAGITSLGYRFSLNGGATWASTVTFNTVQINAAAPAGVPESGSTLAFATLGILALAAMAAHRRIAACR